MRNIVLRLEAGRTKKGIGKTLLLESVQDFLIKLDMKTYMYASSESKHLFDKSCHRQTNKIMNNLHERLKIHAFKVIFLCYKLVDSFQKKIL